MTIDMAALPVQHPTAPASEAARRARFFNSGNAFNIKLPPVPARRFDTVLDAALAASRRMRCSEPSTTLRFSRSMQPHRLVRPRPCIKPPRSPANSTCSPAPAPTTPPLASH